MLSQIFEVCRNLRQLASMTIRNQSLLITYIVFVTKMQKRQTLSNGFALIEKRYHNQLKRCQNERYISDISNRAHLR